MEASAETSQTVTISTLVKSHKEKKTPKKKRTKAKGKSRKKTICECNECGPFERYGRCHYKGRWVTVEGVRVFRCTACDAWAEGCDFGCQCRKRDKIVM